MPTFAPSAKHAVSQSMPSQGLFSSNLETLGGALTEDSLPDDKQQSDFSEGNLMYFD